MTVLDGSLDWKRGLLLLDRTEQLEEPEVLYPFALEELLCRYVGEGGPPLVHLWRHPRAFVMGLRDSRLPGAAEAKRWLEQEGYSVAVRNSGGAAVPLDLGVVNVSLVLPKRRQGELDFRDDFERMYELIREALTDSDVSKGEIVGAYCPGDYDLSIGGRKFCGIAQRRQLHAYVVQAFVVVEGDGREKAAVAREFYRIAAGSSDALDYPRVSETSMASLAELTRGSAATAELFAAAVKRAVRERAGVSGTSMASLAELTRGGGAGAEAGAAARGVWLPEREQVLAMVETLRERYGIGGKRSS